ncbi:MAG: hypothetical protein M1821_004888 [Bathelium mastoideum]|nr:MAG: hypothetical protein M1821_004888 [Bathelium mastoideum]
MSPSKTIDIDFTTFYNIVDGKQRGAKSHAHGVDPTTGEKSWDVPVATEQDLDDAVKAAQKAFESWSQVPIEQRKEKIRALFDLYAEYQEDFTNLLIKESGKPRSFAQREAEGSVSVIVSHHLGLNLPEERFEDDERVAITRYTPLGVVGAICPWNFPITLSVGKLLPALLTGNTIIIKPSPFTPYTALKIAELAQHVLPPGVVQAVGGDDRLGSMMTVHRGISKISFTGSIATGKKVMESCAKTLKRVTLEMGGNDASIILPDVDIEKVAPQVAMGAFMNSGQVCVATKRIYVHESIYEPFLQAMVKAASSFKVGLSNEPGVMLGPIQNKMQYEKVKGFFADSKKNGYKFATGKDEIEEINGGYFIQPTIIDNPPNESRIIAEEPFGPIVPLQPWSDEAEVLQRANNTNTGLGACVWGKDLERAERIARQLQAGSVFVNSFEKLTPRLFFGGHKESGIGGEWGNLGLLSYCNAQVVHVFK